MTTLPAPSARTPVPAFVVIVAGVLVSNAPLLAPAPAPAVSALATVLGGILAILGILDLHRFADGRVGRAQTMWAMLSAFLSRTRRHPGPAIAWYTAWSLICAGLSAYHAACAFHGTDVGMWDLWLAAVWLTGADIGAGSFRGALRRPWPAR